MKLDGELRDVGPLDAIAIPPGARHKIWNTGPDPLVLLCCCACLAKQRHRDGGIA